MKRRSGQAFSVPHVWIYSLLSPSQKNRLYRENVLGFLGYNVLQIEGKTEEGRPSLKPLEVKSAEEDRSSMKPIERVTAEAKISSNDKFVVDKFYFSRITPLMEPLEGKLAEEDRPSMKPIERKTADEDKLDKLVSFDKFYFSRIAP